MQCQDIHLNPSLADRSDVCGVIIIANVTRVFFWLGNRFESLVPD
jgi:hypothetical protein